MLRMAAMTCQPPGSPSAPRAPNLSQYLEATDVVSTSLLCRANTSILIRSAEVLPQTTISKFASPRGHRASTASLPLYIEIRRFLPCDAHVDLIGTLCGSVFPDVSLVCSVSWL